MAPVFPDRYAYVLFSFQVNISSTCIAMPLRALIVQKALAYLL